MSTKRVDVLAVMDDCESLLAAAKIRTDIAAASAAVACVLDALWVATEHNALYFGENHNTVIKGRAALARIAAP